MSQWYLSKNGQALGPLPQDTLIAMIQSGEVGHLDLVYQAGDSEWRPLVDVPEFSEQLKSSPPVQPSGVSDSVEWVLLKKIKSKKGKEYRQLGPFSQQQVLELIDQGEIRFADFCWRQGLDSWVKIVDHPEFCSPLASSAKIDKKIYEQSSLESNSSFLADKESLTMVESFKHEIAAISGNEATEPFAVEEAMTESEIHVDTSEEDFDSPEKLLSLQPPEPSIAMVDELTQEHPLEEGENKLSGAGPVSRNERWQWFAAVAVFALAVLFLYLSLSPSQKHSISGAKDEDKSSEIISQKSVEEKVETTKLIEPTKNESERQFVVDKSTKATPVTNREPVKKEVAVKVAVSKKKAKKKTKTKKIVKSKGHHKGRKSTKVKKRVGTLARGSAKDRSYYLQRDRKALFYSSVKAETLAVDIARQFKKIGKSKVAWKRYYTQWKKKARLSLAKEIRAYPEKNQKYAYPKHIASFKKDYEKIYRYGEVFNSRVLGLRRPSGTPVSLIPIFARHKKLAQSLGR